MFGKNQTPAKTAGPQYVTVGGATVDLRTLSPADSQLAQVDATCNGCGGTEYVCGLAKDSGDTAANLQRVETRAGEWAQNHASTCRATAKAGR
jgi:hypothetical protein